MSHSLQGRRKAIVVSTLSAAIAAAMPAFAQDMGDQAPGAPEGGPVQQPSADASKDVASLDQIVVTAQRRSQSLQSVPIAVTALTAESLEVAGLTDVSSLESAVPSLTFARNGSLMSPYLRGIGTNNNVMNSEPSVATYVDGVYVASGIGALFSFNNIERIEVLKGPQGTLFGRNATGGVIQVVTRDPTDVPEAQVSLGYGNYQTSTATAYVAGGVSSDLAADLAIYYQNQGEGYGKNLFTGTDIHKNREFAARSKWLYTPGDATEVRLALNYSHSKGTGESQQIAPGAVGAGGVTYPGRYNADLNGSFLEDTAWGASLRIDHDFSFARLSSITGYTDTERHAIQDVDLTRQEITNSETRGNVTNFSQEVQLLASEDSKVDWVLGAYYLDASYEYDPLRIWGSALGPLIYRDIFGNQKTESYSVYGQATFALTQKLNLTTGARYTWETQTIHGAFVSPSSETRVPAHSVETEEPTWRVSLDYQFNRDLLGYLSYNRGTKSGGFNLLAPQEPAYAPEFLDAYEIGLKSTLFDNRLRLNMALFEYDYKDIQINVLTGPSVKVLNAAGARLRGLDLDFQLGVSANFTLSGGIGFIDSEYTNYRDAVTYGPVPGPAQAIDATGNDLVYAPKFTASLISSYRIPTSIGEFVLNGALLHNDGFYASASNRLRYPAYTTANASVVWHSVDERYAVRLWANNLTDEKYLAMLTESASSDKQVEAAPRTFGVTFTYSY